MTLDGAFTNLEMTSSSWDALQWLHPADSASRAININVFLFLLNRFSTFFYHPLSSANFFSDMTSVRMSGCAATCTFRKCATTQCLGSRKGVCTSSGFVPLTRPGWAVPPRLVSRCVRRTLWNTPGQQVWSKLVTEKNKKTTKNSS